MNRLCRDHIYRGIVVGTLIIVATIFATRPAYEPRKEHGGENQTSAETAPKIKGNGFYGIGPDAWTAIFTGVLTGFTGLLVATAGLQIRFLIRADETARRSADAAKIAAEAAKQSADATLSVERPFIFIEAKPETLAQKDGPDVSEFAIYLSFTNMGRVPAVIRLIYRECFIASELQTGPKLLFQKVSERA